MPHDPFGRVYPTSGSAIGQVGIDIQWVLRRGSLYLPNSSCVVVSPNPGRAWIEVIVTTSES